MQITQLHLTKENALDILVKEHVYLVRFTEQHGRRAINNRVIPTKPYGVSFKQIKNLSVKEVVDLVTSGKAALVEVIMEEV